MMKREDGGLPGNWDESGECIRTVLRYQVDKQSTTMCVELGRLTILLVNVWVNCKWQPCFCLVEKVVTAANQMLVTLD
jgi:hypothetical protein